jgi:RecA/RadA recombinase
MSWARGSYGGYGSGIGSISSSGEACNGGSSQQRIFWLDGMAGTGKSTIARTVAHSCNDEGRLGASFFFSRGGGELETARTFVTTLAVQLARRHAALRTAICAAVHDHPDIAAQLLSEQWRRLVWGPCERLVRTQEEQAEAEADILLPAAPPVPLPLVVVIDALDECKAPTEIEFVLALLADGMNDRAGEPAPLKIFLTSRPEITVRAGLDSMSESQRRHVILHHVESSVVNHDTCLFFERKLATLIPHRPMLPGLTDQEVLQRLVGRADGLFIWAATACRYIQEGGLHARRRLDVIVNHPVLAAATSPERKLDSIYTEVLQNALREMWTADEKEEFCHLLNDVVGTIAVLFSSLSASGLATLLSRSEHDILDVLCDLHSIFDIPDDRSEPIRPHHASVRNFILSRQRCTDARFWVDERQAHTYIARQSLLLMTKTLKKDICGLEDPGELMEYIDQERIDACVSPALRYACLYWVHHVEQGHSPAALRKPINSFIREHYLHWLEVLALIGKLSDDGVQMVALLDALFVSLLYLAARAELQLTSNEE